MRGQVANGRGSGMTAKTTSGRGRGNMYKQKQYSKQDKCKSKHENNKGVVQAGLRIGWGEHRDGGQEK